MLFKNFLLVAVGGMIGSALRYLGSLFIKSDHLPYATFTVNVLGSFLIGLIMGIASRQENFGSWRLFLATGICGGFTTFSALAWENFQLLEQQRYGSFILYLGGTLVLGLGAVALGYWMTKS